MYTFVIIKCKCLNCASSVQGKWFPSADSRLKLGVYPLRIEQ